MPFEKIEFLSAVLLVSEQPERLYEFYKNILKIPLEVEQHNDFHKHYGCELGDLHFAIHPAENFQGNRPGVGSVKLAFEIFDMKSFVQHLKEQDVELLYDPKPLGPSLLTAIRDPDGNEIEFTQLSDGWFEHLQERRNDGHDIIVKWKGKKASDA